MFCWRNCNYCIYIKLNQKPLKRELKRKNQLFSEKDSIDQIIEKDQERVQGIDSEEVNLDKSIAKKNQMKLQTLSSAKL